MSDEQRIAAVLDSIARRAVDSSGWIPVHDNERRDILRAATMLIGSDDQPRWPNLDAALEHLEIQREMARGREQQAESIGWVRGQITALEDERRRTIRALNEINDRLNQHKTALERLERNRDWLKKGDD